MNKKILRLTILVLAVLSVLFFAIYGRAPGHSPAPIHDLGSVKLYTSQVIGRNIRFPVYVNSHTLRFFTGTTFAEFDLDNFTSRSLTKEFALPGVERVEWQGNLALIKVDKATIFDDLYSSANSDARNESSWWIVDLTSGSLKQVVSNVAGYSVVDVSWGSTQNNYLYVLSQKKSKSDEFLELQNTAAQNIASTKTHDLSLMGYTQEGMLVRQSDKSLMVWKNNKLIVVLRAQNSSTTVLSNERYFIFEDRSSSAAGASPSETNGNIFEYDTSTPKHLTQILGSSNNSGNYSALQDGLLELPSPPGTTTSITGTTSGSQGVMAINSGGNINRYAINIDGGSSIVIGSLKSSILLSQPAAGQFTLATTNVNNNLFLLSTDRSVSQKSSPYPLVFLPGNSRSLANATTAYDALNNRLDIFFQVSGSLQSMRQTAIQELRSDGDPNQVFKVWHSFSP